MIIVTGTGRCGTLLAAKTLSAAGVACTHETVFPLRGHVRFDLLQDAESSHMAVPYLAAGLFQYATVVLAVRHPLACIRSWTAAPIDVEVHRWRCQQVGLELDLSVEGWARFWLRWNKWLCSRITNTLHVWRLEDGAAALLRVLELGSNAAVPKGVVNAHAPADAPLVQANDIAWSVRTQLRRGAECFGYTL